jgi:DNA-binding transcriptional LysR family regulator
VELRQLRYFIAVAEELHFRRAAQRMHLTQPALSEQVRKLEAELGMRLFDRTSRGVALTPAGAAMLEEGKRVLRQAEAAERAARGACRHPAGRLRLGYPPYGFPAALPRALRRLRAVAPLVDVVFESRPPLAMVEDVRADRLDAAIVCAPGPLDGLRATDLAPEGALAVVPGSAPRNASVLEQIESTKLVLLPYAWNPAFYDGAIAAVRRAGAEPVAVEAAADGVVHALLTVAAGLGVALLPESSVDAHPLRGVRAQPLLLPAPVCWTAIVTRRDEASPIVTAFRRAAATTTGVDRRRPRGAAAARASGR